MVDPIEQLQRTLGDRYRIEREIGRGGMATVFLAEELHPRRQVALKVLAPDLARSTARDRFLREVELASNLTHPHIVPIFTAGEIGELLYYVMPYIEGQSLRARMLQEGKLSVEDALEITSEVGGALQYAHSQGVVHRDIKPENILLSNGHAVVADFGIARALCAACGDNITLAGMPIGTPGYMSPEQAMGEEVDQRSDLYSLAAMLYEMLAGQPPFYGQTLAAIIRARYTEPTPSLHRAGWAGSDTIDQAIQRALQLEPDQRFDSVKAFLATIIPRRFGDFLPSALPVFHASPHPEKSVAVLPFANLSPDPDNEYFSDGITDDIITQLSKVRGLHVTSRTSVMRYKQTTKSVAQISSELGVANVLEGSVRRAGNRVRVVAQLIDAKTDKHMWADRYDRELTDIFEIQGEIAERIVDALEATLTPADKERLGKKPTDNLSAYNLYLQGRFHWNRFTPTGVQRGLEFFERAAELDGEYALAYAGVADSYLLMGAPLAQLPPKEAFRKAKAAALRALALDDTLADAHATLGAVYTWFEWDWTAAEQELERALELDPANEKPCLMRAFHLAATGRHESAMEFTRRAITLCPASVIIHGHMGLQLFWARRYPEAIEHLRRTGEMDPTFPPAYYILAWALLESGSTEDAVAAARTAAELTGNTAARRGGLGCALAAAGRRDEAEAILAELEARRNTEYVSAGDIALLHSYLGRIDDAFAWLDVAIEERSAWLAYLDTDPIWDRLRPDPRFDAALRRIGFPRLEPRPTLQPSA